MGQESSKTKPKQRGVDANDDLSRKTSKSSLQGTNETEECHQKDTFPSLGTSVDAVMNDKLVHFTPDEKRSSQNLRNKEMIENKYSSLKGDIEEVRGMNSEILEKLSLLEKRSEEKKKQRSINRMKSTKHEVSMKIPNGSVQTGKGKRDEALGLLEISNTMKSKADVDELDRESKVDRKLTENKMMDICDSKEDSDSLNESFKSAKNFDIPPDTNAGMTEVESASPEARGLSSDSSEVTNNQSDKAVVMKTESADDRKIVEVHQNENVDKNETNHTTPIATKEVIRTLSSTESGGDPGETSLANDSIKGKQAPADFETNEDKGENESVHEPEMKGFTETFELTFPQMEYNLMLRRTKTNEKQDNRLSLQFNLQPNTGCIYRTSPTNEPDLNSSANNGKLSEESGKQLEYEKHDNAVRQAPKQQKCDPKLEMNQKSTAKRTSVWKITPTKQEAENVKTRKPERPEVELISRNPTVGSGKPSAVEKTSPISHKRVSDEHPVTKTDTGSESAHNENAKSIPTVADAHLVVQDRKETTIDAKSTSQSSAMVPLATHFMQLWFPALEKMGVSVEVRDDVWKIGEMEWKLDFQSGKIKVGNAEEMRKEIEQAKAEMERCDEDMDESEMEQFKFLFDMLNILSAMSSEEGADSFEAFKRCLESLNNVNLEEMLGEEEGRQMQEVVRVSSQMMTTIKPILSAAQQLSLEGQAASHATVASGLQTQTPDQQAGGTVTEFQKPEAKLKQDSAKQQEKSAYEAKSLPGKNINTDAPHSLATKLNDASASEGVIDEKSATRVKVTEQTSLKTETTQDTEGKEEEVVWIDESSWIDAANVNIAKGQPCRDIRERGMDTIICLDLSSSMRGAAWDQALAFIRGFIECIQSTTLRDNIFEHVALVTFGSETKVQQHMTCDYFDVLRKLEHLKPGGPSPLLAGILMCLAAVRGAGSVFCANDYQIHPRVFLITDGRATPAGMISGPDHCSTLEIENVNDSVQNLVNSIHNEHHWTVNPVPVGSFDLTLLEKLAEDTHGKITSPEDWRKVSRTMKNLVVATKVGSQEELFGSLALMSLLLPAVADHVLTADDHVEISEFLETHKKETAFDEVIEDSRLPPIATRVRRTKKLLGVDDACNLGTVTKRFRGGYIGVTWDRAPPNVFNERQKIKFSYESESNDVVITEEPRLLRDELIAVGCTVRRGKDWHYANQDGGAGNLGTVFDVESNGILRIRWRNGHINSYRYGSNGRFDVEIVSPSVSGTGPISDEITIEGAVGGSQGSLSTLTIESLPSVPSTFMFSSDDESDSSVSSDDSTMTLEEKMNKRNAKNSRKQRKLNIPSESSNTKYIIEPKKTSSDESEKVVIGNDNLAKEIVTVDETSDETHKEMQLNMSGVDSAENYLHDEDNNNEDRYKNAGEIKITQNVALDDSALDKKQQKLESSGAKPKDSQREVNIYYSAETKDSTGAQNKGDLSQQMNEKKPFAGKLSSSRALPTNHKRLQDVTSGVPRNSINTVDRKLQITGKVIEQEAQCSDDTSKEQRNQNNVLELPADSVNPNTTAGKKTPSKLQSDKDSPGNKTVIVDGSSTTATVTWQWNRSGKWEVYHAEVRDKIEKSFQAKKPSVLITANSKAYRVVFARMVQVDIKTKEVIKVQRL